MTSSAATSPSTACCSIRFSPHPNTAHGELLDYVGGRRDLERGIVRTIGQPSRASPKTSCACCAPCALPRASDTRSKQHTAVGHPRLAAQIHQVSQERIRDELTKMLTEGHARRAFELLD